MEKNKKKNVLIMAIIVLTVMVVYLSDNYIFKENNEDINESKSSEIKNNGPLVLMLEDSNGNYVESTDSTWPTKDYKFNSELSRCKNGSELIYDEKNNIVTLATEKSEKCYVYFSKLTLASECTGQNMASCFAENYTLDNSIIYHDVDGAKQGTLTANNSNLSAGDKSYRYAGPSSEVKNYVCVGVEPTVEICPESNLHRIIGIIPTDETATEYQVKLIQNTPTKKYKWSGSESLYNTNDWNQSTLRTDILNNTNGDYWKSLGTDASKVTEHNWVISGANWSIMYDRNVQIAYKYEVVSTCEDCTDKEVYATLSNKVGLMYVSDYMYAASPSRWNVVGRYYSSTDNWLHIQNTGLTREYEWTISRDSSNVSNSFAINDSGAVYTSGVYSFDFYARPSIYLGSSVQLSSGKGTSTDPYRIK